MGLIIILILIGVVLLLAELLLFPGVGVAGILGLLSLVGANFLAFSLHPQPMGIIVLIATMTVCFLSMWYALRAKTWKHLSLSHEIESKAISLPQDQGIYIGMKGRALGRLIPTGKVRLGNIDVEANAFQGVIDPGTEIEVVEIENLRIFVSPVRSD